MKGWISQTFQEFHKTTQGLWNSNSLQHHNLLFSSTFYSKNKLSFWISFFLFFLIFSLFFSITFSHFIFSFLWDFPFEHYFSTQLLLIFSFLFFFCIFLSFQTFSSSQNFKLSTPTLAFHNSMEFQTCKEHETKSQSLHR